ncbi:hypothetical protein [Mesorhizobium sp. IMUNJ 23232]|uniref:hypothetical protein n=1 Tax=Mesorhizobium sp. IMUNJ 23232 TaxID=3376064 RepID=UPI0037A1C485
MDRTEREDEQETLKSIAVMLLRLAVLAEFLCVLPLFLRALLLPLMRYAEAVARAFAIERAGGALALPPATVHGPDGDGRAEALRLARCLRALSSIFGCLQDFAGRLYRGGPDGRLARHAPATGWGHFLTARCALAFRMAGRIDTS